MAICLHVQNMRKLRILGTTALTRSAMHPSSNCASRYALIAIAATLRGQAYECRKNSGELIHWGRDRIHAFDAGSRVPARPPMRSALGLMQSWNSSVLVGP